MTLLHAVQVEFQYAKELNAEARRAGKTMTSRDAMLQATDEMTADFETLMRGRYGDIVVDVFGIPQP